MYGAGHNQFNPIKPNHYVPMPMLPNNKGSQQVMQVASQALLQTNYRDPDRLFTKAHKYTPIAITHQEEVPKEIVMTRVVASRALPRPARQPPSPAPPPKAPRADAAVKPAVKQRAKPIPPSSHHGNKLLKLKAEYDAIGFFNKNAQNSKQDELTQARGELAGSVKREMMILRSTLFVAKKNATEEGRRTSGVELLKSIVVLDDLEAKTSLLVGQIKEDLQGEIDKARAELRAEIVKCMESLRQELSRSADLPDLLKWNHCTRAAETWNLIFERLLNTSMGNDPVLKNSIGDVYKQIDKSSKYLFNLIKKQIHKEGKINPRARTIEYIQFGKSLERLPGTKTVLQLRNAVATEIDVKVFNKTKKLPK